MRDSLIDRDSKQRVRYAAILWKPDLEHGIDVTDGHETAVGRLVMAGHFGVDVSQSDGAMKDWLSKTRSNRGKLTLRRCKQALLELLVDSGCSEDQETTDWTLDNHAATWHTQLVGSLPGGQWCFAVLTIQDYPLRYVREYLTRLSTSLKSDPGIQSKMKKWLPRPKDGGLNVGLRPLLSSLCQEFADLSNVSKVHAIIEDVDKVKQVMEENISIAIGNIDSAAELETTTSQLEAGAKIFEGQATSLRKRECWTSVKMNVAIAAACVLLCAVAGVTIWGAFSGE